jgi:hypothetical protein
MIERHKEQKKANRSLETLQVKLSNLTHLFLCMFMSFICNIFTNISLFSYICICVLSAMFLLIFLYFLCMFISFICNVSSYISFFILCILMFFICDVSSSVSSSFFDAYVSLSLMFSMCIFPRCFCFNYIIILNVSISVCSK